MSRSTWLALALVGCVEAPAPALPRPAPIAAAPVIAAAPASESGELRALMQALAASAVRHDAPVRTVLYTWTTEAQEQELRTERVLLSREVADGGERSRFDEALAADPGPLAARLQEPGRKTRRFAWPTPWATVMGWDGQGYGPVLVRVVLRPEAIVARFTPGASETSPKGAGEPVLEGQRWRMFTADGAEIAEAEAVAAPERLAAVYHVAPPQGERPGYREFVLVQERMIAEWSLGTADIRAQIEAEAELLSRVADSIETLRALAAARCGSRGAAGCPEAEVAEDSAGLAAWSAGLIAGPWAEGPPEADVLLADLYAANLAVPAVAYAPTEARLRAIAQRLRALADPPRPPLVVQPVLEDIKPGKPRKPGKTGKKPPPPRCWDPSFGSFDCEPSRQRP